MSALRACRPQFRYAPIACTGKEPMTAVMAKKVANSMNRRKDVAINAYRCRACGDWHVGGNTK